VELKGHRFATNETNQESVTQKFIPNTSEADFSRAIENWTILNNKIA